MSNGGHQGAQLDIVAQ